MAWLWAVVAGIAVAMPAAAWGATRNLAHPGQSPTGPRPRLDRGDRWLYDRYPLRVTDRWRVKQAVLEGRELSEPLLRTAARDLANVMLTGQIRGMSPK